MIVIVKSSRIIEMYFRLTNFNFTTCNIQPVIVTHLNCIIDKMPIPTFDLKTVLYLLHGLIMKLPLHYKTTAEMETSLFMIDDAKRRKKVNDC